MRDIDEKGMSFVSKCLMLRWALKLKSLPSIDDAGCKKTGR